MTLSLPPQPFRSIKSTILIAMADTLIADMLLQWLSVYALNPIGVHNDGSMLLEKIKEQPPDCLFIDSELPLLDGFELARKLAQAQLNTRIIIYASKKDPDYLRDFLLHSQQNIKGFIHKGCGLKELEICLQEVLAGRTYLSTRINEYLNSTEIDSSETKKIKDKLACLTAKEKQVLMWLSKGLTEKEVAAAMHISINTVKTYKQRIIEKMELTTQQRVSYIATLYKKEIEYNLLQLGREGW